MDVRVEIKFDVHFGPHKNTRKIHSPFCSHLFQIKIITNIFGNSEFNPLNDELNPICYLLALLGAHHFLHVSRIRVKSLTLRLLTSYIYIYIYMTLVA